ncbi:nitronate monooxygenase [Uliginosibacterium sp. H3]|uniref:Nitronate monooxygenase n=1 Tax=Uliginosibacterium silvisoli TaxID=3114758 RepID=A0ABU6K1A6_9RHOO|nr:nitronate monooxygenase [Uliginosibacterium sp. H3]
MSLPTSFRSALRLPAIAAPMFLVSGPELVIATCRAGVAGSLPALNARPASQLDEWLTQIETARSEAQAAQGSFAPYGINLILHASNPRLQEDLDIVVRHRVPFVITSLGHPGAVVEAVHGYGGLVFSDVIHAHHARKAIAAGVDGIIAVAAGAGGHAGTQSPMSLVREIREFWDGCLILGGAISDGYAIRAAEVLGADLAYLGTRFIATAEARAQPAYKQMLVEARAQDIVYTDVISGANANFLLPSLTAAGHTRESLQAGIGKAVLKDLAEEAKAWRDVWSAGHGVATIHDAPEVATLVGRLRDEYLAACRTPSMV